MKYLLVVFFFSCAALEKTSEKIFKKPVRDTKVLNVSWNKNLDPEYKTGNLPISGITPKITSDKLMVGSLEGGVYVYNHNGINTAHLDTNGAVVGRPLLKNNILYYGTNEGYVVATDLATKKVIFKEFLQSPVESDVIAHEDLIIVRLRSHVVVALNKTDGKIKWHYKRSVAQLSTLNRLSTPKVYKDNLIFGTADGYLVSVKLIDGALEWERKLSNKKKFIDIDMTPSLIDNKIWIGSLGGDFHLINPDNGNVINKYKLNASAEPVYIGHKVYIFDDTGHVYVFSLDGKLDTKKKISKFSFGSAKFWKHYLVASTYKGHILAIDPRTLKVVDTFHLGHKFSSIFGHLETDGKSLAAYSSRNRLYVFK